MSRKSKAEILSELLKMKAQNDVLSKELTDAASVADYEFLIRSGTQCGKTVKVWTDAFQQAIGEHEIIRIPAREEPYYIDRTLILPSNRRIEAEDGAVICQMEGVKVVLLRNEHVQNGTHTPIHKGCADQNISIIGGRWEESHRERGGYGTSGMIDEQRSFFGVSTCFFFNNIEHLTLRNLNLAHTAGFGIQIGDVRCVYAENIEFSSCYADGLHVNGNTSYLLVRNLRGEVGDDLLALNMHDWQNSSVNFGPGNMIWAEDLHLYSSSRYKAFRMFLGEYAYDDGSCSDCSLNNAVIHNVRGINTFKMYYQTPSYSIADKNPEPGKVGHGDNLYFENLDIDLDAPVDWLPPYYESDPVRGDFAAFEVGSNLQHLTLENIRLTLHRDRYPYSYLLTCGPKSVQDGDCEIFDPYVHCRLEHLTLKNISINGNNTLDFTDYLKTIQFDDLYHDGFSTGSGQIGTIHVEG